MKVDINSIEIYIDDLNEEARELFLKAHGLKSDDISFDFKLLCVLKYDEDLICPYD